MEQAKVKVPLKWSNVSIDSFDELFSFLQTIDETDKIEAKEATFSVDRSFLETVSAFSNEPGLGGGYIFLGLRKNDNYNEDNHHYIVTGVSDADLLQQQIASLCSQSFNVVIRPITKVIAHQNKKIVLVFIEEAKAFQKPLFIKSDGREKGAFRRIGSTDQVCTQDDLDLLYQLRSDRKYDLIQEEQASIEDFDDDAISLYRRERGKTKQNASELRFNDEDLLKSLRAITTEKGVTLPTIGGILLFGNKRAIRRLYPLRSAIDYMLIEGRDWNCAPEKRYTAFEMRESLITGVPHLINQIMADIPQSFALEDDEIRRKDNPIIPRKVIREALVNAVMHRDYRVISPVQIIKYANRIEFRNQGYSLKPNVSLGIPGSVERNEIINQVFQDIQYAEAKGTGIGTMRDLMQQANLSVPLIETDRTTNLFVLTLLPHNLFNAKDIEWLGQYKEYNLTNQDARTLIILREIGIISNADYRTIHAVDTLTASAALRKLRDTGLIEQKGAGNATYYIPTRKFYEPMMLEPSGTNSSSETNKLRTAPPENAHESFIANELLNLIDTLPDSLKFKLKKAKRLSPEIIRAIIKHLCMQRPLKLSEFARIFDKNPRHIRDYYLTPMIEAGELEYSFAENPAHPLQAYKEPSKISNPSDKTG